MKTRSRCPNRRGWLWSLLLVVVLLSHCSPRILWQSEIPVADQYIRRPGSTIYGSFKVAEGSFMLGDAQRLVSLHPTHFGQPLVWTALFVVTGDPYSVISNYVEQAVAAGLSSAGSYGRCGSGRQFFDRHEDLVFQGSRGEHVVCVGHARAFRQYSYASPVPGHPVEEVVTEYASFDLAFLRTKGKLASRIPQSHLYMSYVQNEPPPWHEPTVQGFSPSCPVSSCGSMDETPLPPVPQKWAGLPGRGQRFARGLVRDEPGIKVEKGSQLVGPPTLTMCMDGTRACVGSGAVTDVGCLTGFRAVLAVTGDPERVVSAYLKQMGSPSVPNPVRVTTYLEGRAVRASHSERGYRYSFYASDPEGPGPTFMWVSRCEEAPG